MEVVVEGRAQVQQEEQPEQRELLLELRRQHLLWACGLLLLAKLAQQAVLRQAQQAVT
jgi:hypothetical protein